MNKLLRKIKTVNLLLAIIFWHFIYKKWILLQHKKYYISKYVILFSSHWHWHLMNKPQKMVIYSFWFEHIRKSNRLFHCHLLRHSDSNKNKFPLSYFFYYFILVNKKIPTNTMNSLAISPASSANFTSFSCCFAKSLASVSISWRISVS